MSNEIERRFLVVGDEWRQGAIGKALKQGFLSTTKERVVRVRVWGDDAFLTIKGAAVGVTRAEFEYAIPKADAEFMLENLCLRPFIEKVRHKILHDGLIWELDEFFGENAGLVMAEVELEREDQPLNLPSWVGKEVSLDGRYQNASLAERPYRLWKDEA
ncbi:MAG: CYTH domain-containing protein [Magnetococcales bacterium]|nr:CYTH domain-containing protein [Magnetococcales bacterium]NGZ27774.1 CYTH domain-containing protein [Magnetococcales bacterium]